VSGADQSSARCIVGWATEELDEEDEDPEEAEYEGAE
jgi:hypothetical protein